MIRLETGLGIRDGGGLSGVDTHLGALFKVRNPTPIQGIHQLKKDTEHYKLFFYKLNNLWERKWGSNVLEFRA